MRFALIADDIGRRDFLIMLWALPTAPGEASAIPGVGRAEVLLSGGKSGEVADLMGNALFCVDTPRNTLAKKMTEMYLNTKKRCPSLCLVGRKWRMT